MIPRPRFLPEIISGHIRESGDKLTSVIRRAIIPPDAPTRGRWEEIILVPRGLAGNRRICRRPPPTTPPIYTPAVLRLPRIRVMRPPTAYMTSTLMIRCNSEPWRKE